MSASAWLLWTLGVRSRRPPLRIPPPDVEKRGWALRRDLRASTRAFPRRTAVLLRSTRLDESSPTLAPLAGELPGYLDPMVSYGEGVRVALAAGQAEVNCATHR